VSPVLDTGFAASTDQAARGVDKPAPGALRDIDGRVEARRPLLADGYRLTWTTSLLPDEDVRYELSPTDAGPVPLAVEISALEQELDSRGYSVALNQYRQAINAFGQHAYEAANSQLRATLEDLVVQIAVSHTGFVKPPNQGGGGQAIDRLKATSNLDARDGGGAVGRNGHDRSQAGDRFRRAVWCGGWQSPLHPPRMSRPPKARRANCRGQFASTGERCVFNPRFGRVALRGLPSSRSG
jgi:hypothetical protein